VLKVRAETYGDFFKKGKWMRLQRGGKKEWGDGSPKTTGRGIFFRKKMETGLRKIFEGKLASLPDRGKKVRKS